MLQDKKFLTTGIADENSLAMYVAKEIQKQNGSVVCTGLGETPFHQNISDKAKQFLHQNYADFEKAVDSTLGAETIKQILDVSIEESVAQFAEYLSDNNLKLNGFLHAIAMDKTIRQKSVRPILDVNFNEFCDTMEVSAYSLVRISHYLLKYNVLEKNSSVVSLSYVAADRVTFHPYKNISIAKAALERLTIELADELGRSHGIRYNAIRFSPYMGSKAGNATLNQQDFDTSNKISPLGNAMPQDLADEVVHLFRPNGRITGEIRHIDGGYNKIG